MSRLMQCCAAGFVLLAVAATASADLIKDGDFENGTPGTNLNVGPQFTYPTTGPFGKWFDVNQWQYVAGGVGGSVYAGHVTTGNNVNLLFQMIDVSGGAVGGQATLAFDWRFDGGGTDRDVWVLGLTGAAERIEKFANFFPSGNSNSPPGDILLALGTSDLPVTTNGWTRIERTFNIPSPNTYDALAVMFKVGSSGTSSNWPLIRGVDNVSLEPVPEPGTIALVLLGAAAIALRRRRRA